MGASGDQFFRKKLVTRLVTKNVLLFDIKRHS